MNVESFGFSLLTALLGMALVVLFLVLLSVIMYVIKRLNREPTGSESGSRTAGSTPSEVAGWSARAVASGAAADAGRDVAQGNTPPLPGWALAAAAAFLADEERAAERQISTGPWLTYAGGAGHGSGRRFIEGRSPVRRGE